ncbi:helix-turn-helix domain-containing protein [Leifsonia poae]|uniref:helix-turn-helix domain-containing protein n=1 Tax=Leifsonia poae TaxID=110933 RepID=UPI003D671FBF
MEATTTSSRTGGRSAAVIHNVRTAVEELVKERGSDRVTVPMIAERAGVNPTSIYRRWGDLPTLLNDIATYRLDPERPLAQTGSLQGDLTPGQRRSSPTIASPSTRRYCAAEQLMRASARRTACATGASRRPCSSSARRMPA